MRVLHVSQPTTAGVPRVVADLVRDQVARGWEVLVASPDDGHLRADATAAGGRHLSWQATRPPGPSTVSETRSLARIVAGCEPELVHLHSAKAGLAGRLVLRGRRPTVFQPHAWSFLAVEGPLRAASTVWERRAARWCDALAVVSADEQRTGERAGVRATWARLPNGVDLSRRRPAGPHDRAAARTRLGLDDAPLAVCVGRLSRQKGQDVLLGAWPAVRAALPAARLVLVGDGPDRRALEGRHVDGAELVGAVADPDDWLTAADVVVLPSRWEAGLSLAAMEAMALGRSVVATDVAGTAEGLADGAGAVVPVDDAAALAGAVTERLRDPERAAAEGSAARATVERRYDLTVTSACAAALYEQVLRARAARP